MAEWGPVAYPLASAESSAPHNEFGSPAGGGGGGNKGH